MVTGPGEEHKDDRGIHSSYQGAIESQANIPHKEENMKIRPQIILAILVLGMISGISLFQEGDQYIAVVTGCTGGIIALGMKLLDGE
jgi:hypothetical protein